MMNSKKGSLRIWAACLLLNWLNFSNPVQAQNKLSFPPPTLYSAGVTNFLEDMGCYDRIGLAGLGVFKEDCELWERNARECLATGERLVSTTPWYSSKLFWFFAGVGLGLGGIGIYQISK